MVTTVLDRPASRQETRTVPPLPHPSWTRAFGEPSGTQGRISPREFWERLGL